jgi:methionyl-tRNA formyltransferase
MVKILPLSSNHLINFCYSNKFVKKKNNSYQVKFNSKKNSINIIGNGRSLVLFKNEAKKFTTKVFLNKKKRYNQNDIIFSINNPNIISKDILRKAICFNYHDSYLPKYKGLYSSTWAIIKKSKYHGCTFFLVDSGIDTGPIIYQKKFKILSCYTSHNIDIINLNFAFFLFKKILNDLFYKKKILIKKINSKGNYFSRRDLLKIELCGFIHLNWAFKKIMTNFNALSCNKAKRNFIVNPKVLSSKNNIYEIKRISRVKFMVNNNFYSTGFCSTQNKKIYLKKGNNILEIIFKKNFKKIKLASLTNVRKYIKDKKNSFNLR